MSKKKLVLFYDPANELGVTSKIILDSLAPGIHSSVEIIYSVINNKNLSPYPWLKKSPSLVWMLDELPIVIHEGLFTQEQVKSIFEKLEQ